MYGLVHLDTVLRNLTDRFKTLLRTILDTIDIFY
jgi:hypothetical protein